MKTYMKRLTFLIAGLISISSQANDDPIYVNISFLSVLVAPTKVNSNTWDASAKINAHASGLLADMMLPGSGIATGTIISKASELATQGKAAPDVIGYVVLTGPTTRNLVNIAGTPIALATKINRTKDSYTPRFNTSYYGWPMYQDTRFQIHLWDLDLVNHDPIGVVEITKKHVVHAIDEGIPIWVNVANQSMNQLLYVQISATKARKYTKTRIDGYRYY